MDSSSIEAIQAVAAARRDMQRVPADWRARLRAIRRDLRGLTGLAHLPLPGSGIHLSGQRGFRLAPEDSITGNDPEQKFFARLEECSDFIIDGLTLRRGRNGIFLHRCRRFRIINIDLSDLHGYGIILFDCSDFEVEGVRVDNLLCSAVTCIGDTRMGALRNIQASNGRGFYNCDAGVVLEHCTAAVTAEDIPERCHEAQSIFEKNKRPHCIELTNIHVRGYRAQGIYLAGALSCRISRSVLERSNKEGICFDWGTAHCELTLSRITGNGRRAGMTPEEIRADFITQFPLLPDGSSAVKLPGISMDNAAFNRVTRNLIHGNYGGAVKVIRACVGNRIELNLGWANTSGDNEHFRFKVVNNVNALDPLGELQGARLFDIGPSYDLDVRRNLLMGRQS